MKINKKQVLGFSSIFMTTRSRKFTKIRLSVFHQFSWPRGHEKSQKSGALFFINFHDPAVMKIQKNQALCFSSIFMTPRSWKFTKISHSVFEMTVCHREFEMTVCHGEFEMTMCHQICSSNFMTPRSRKFTKIRRLVFHQSSWPRGHENS